MSFKITIKILGVLAFIRLLMIPNTSSMTIGILLQAVLFGSVILYALFFSKFSRRMHKVICIGFLVPLSLVGFLAIYGNSSNATFDEDVVIVLGAGVVGERVTTPLARRLGRAIYYFERNPNAYIIVCGGLGNTATITEAEAMARYLYARGIPRERILQEELSTSTLENLTFAQEILSEHFNGEFTAVVISNDFHMFRAISIARRVGIDANHLGAPTPTRLLAENYLRESVAVVHFWVFGVN
ncbi:MAG: YdcF family protein [Defluviitaleaceae bacterium]|nr:YdcF family protein [Defluviitaleaceae bacterium]